MYCQKCGELIPEGTNKCAKCGAETTDSLLVISDTLKRIEEGQNKNLKLMKSISSSTAILAGIVIIQIILTFVMLMSH